MTNKPNLKKEFDDILQVKVFTTTKNPINFKIHKKLLILSLMFILVFVSVTGFLFYYNLNLLSKVEEKEAEIYSLKYETNIWKNSTINLQNTLEEKNDIINIKTANIEEKLKELEDFKEYINNFIYTGDEDIENSLVSRSSRRDFLIPKVNDEKDININELLNEFDMILDNNKEDLNLLYEKVEDRVDYLNCFPDHFPTAGRISSNFGYRRNPFSYSWEFHHGVDIANKLGTEIYSSGEGQIILVDYDYLFGKYILIDHGYGIMTKYAHLYKTNVEPGDYVKKGDLIAYMGYTGQSTGPHLHYEIIINNEAVDPLKIKNYYE